jgi:hypothetical protein
VDWTDTGWQRSAHAWIRRQVEVTGPITQPHVRPWSTTMRVPTGAGVLWFKANGPGTLYEAGLVAALGRLAPDLVPVPVAVDAARGWSLSPDGGEPMAAPPDPARWEALLPRYAELQRTVAGHVAELVDLGVPDLRLERMPAHFAEVTGGDARAGRYAGWCAELAAVGIAPSLQHDDLHDANVFRHGDGYRIVDWGDSSVAHPFGTLLITLRVLAARLNLPAGDPVLDRLRDAYLEPWTGEHDRPSLRHAADLAVRVALVGRVLVWRRALLDADDAALAEYGDVTDGWLDAVFAAEPP